MTDTNDDDQNVDRRDHIPRRDDDREIAFRLNALEREVAGNTREIAAIRTALGDRFTTLTSNLDGRYMPRSELETVYVPRREHEEKRRQERGWLVQLPLAVFAAASWATTVILALLHHTG